MAWPQGASVVLALLALAVLAGAAAGKENLTTYLPAEAELAPLKLQIEKLENATRSALVNTHCNNLRAGAGAFENVGVLLPSDPEARTRDNTLARITLFRFNTSADAGSYFQCMLDNRNRSSQADVRPAPYGDRGMVAEFPGNSVTGASALFIRGPYLVAVDSLQEVFPSDWTHALAKMVDERLPRGAVKSPGFEAAAALAGLAAAAWVRGRRARP